MVIYYPYIQRQFVCGGESAVCLCRGILLEQSKKTNVELRVLYSGELDSRRLFDQSSLVVVVTAVFVF